MNKLTAGLCLVLWSLPACAEETVRTISWGKLKESGALRGGAVVASEPFEQLKVEGRRGQRTVPRAMGCCFGERRPAWAIAAMFGTRRKSVRSA